MKERIVNLETLDFETSQEVSLRPDLWEDFIGQEKIKSNLQISICAAKKRQESLDHMLFFGPPGLGKTSISHIIAKEMETNIKITAAPMIEKSGDLAAILTNLQAKDILFIDEIHRLSPAIEEVLYPAMEDFRLDIIIGSGPAAQTIKIDLPPFTLIGATTRAGMLSNPLRDRFGMSFRMQFYSPSAFKNNININAPVSMISAKFGYQKYFVPYFGTRFYGDLLLGGGVLKEDTLKQSVGSFIYVLGAVNTDLLFDMPLDFKTKKHFLGVYAGFGIGLMLYQDKPNQNGRNLVVGGYSSPNFLWKSLIEVDYTFNVGVSLTLYRKHRLEIGTKLPISYLRMGVEEGALYQNKEDDERLLVSANNQFKRSSFLLVNYAFIF